MDSRQEANMHKALEGIALLTWPIRTVWHLICGLVKTALYAIAGALVLFCGVLWVLYRFVLRLAGTPVDWHAAWVMGPGDPGFPFLTCAALLSSYAFIVLYPFVGLYVVGGSWVAYRKHWNEYHFGEGFLAGLAGFVYGVLVSILTLYLYSPGFCDWNLGSVLIVLTAATLAPVAISLYKQGKSNTYIVAMVAFLAMEAVAFCGEIEPNIWHR